MLAGYVVVCLAGLALLARASDALVTGSSALASRLGLPAVVIGVTVIGFGTSAPELVVSILAAAGGCPAIGIGTVIGSNIANLSLILGIAALVAPIAVRSEVIRREAPLAMLATLAFAAALQAGLTPLAGALLIALLAGSLILLIRWALQDTGATVGEEQSLGDDVAELESVDAGLPLRRVVLQAAAGLAGTLLGSQALVWGAVAIAHASALSEGFIGSTIVAVGTSLPELVTSAQAARRGEPDLVLGNLLGSNLFNALAVGGAVGLIGSGATTDPALRVVGVLVMIAVSALAIAFMRRRFVVIRGEAATLVAVYVAILPLMAG